MRAAHRQHEQHGNSNSSNNYIAPLSSWLRIHSSHSSPRQRAFSFRRMLPSLKLLLCALGLMACFIVYGVVQERIMTRSYGAAGTSAVFTVSSFLVLLNRIVSSTCVLAFMLLRRERVTPQAPLHRFFLVAALNASSTYMQYEVLKYVTFPLQTLVKSAKMIPVLIWGTLLRVRRYTLSDYVVAFLITAGVLVFASSGSLVARRVPSLAQSASTAQPQLPQQHLSPTAAPAAVVDATVQRRLARVPLTDHDRSTSSLHQNRLSDHLHSSLRREEPPPHAHGMWLSSLLFAMSVSPSVTRSALALRPARTLLQAEDAANSEDGSANALFMSVCLVLLFLILDSGTTSTQEQVFKSYRMTSHHQMLWVNILSIPLVLAVLLATQQLWIALAFVQRFPLLLWHAFLLSLCSLVGQLLIYETIRSFGALTLSLVMTTRSFLSIFLSCVLYDHSISPLQIMATVVVFACVYYHALHGSSLRPSSPAAHADASTATSDSANNV